MSSKKMMCLQSFLFTRGQETCVCAVVYVLFKSLHPDRGKAFSTHPGIRRDMKTFITLRDTGLCKKTLKAL